MKKNTLSVIMPALNEEKNIETAIVSTLDSFEKHEIDGEIIVINDGSTDKTRDIVEGLSQKTHKIKIISHKKPMGIGYSFIDGVKNSEKDVVVMFPGDNENNPDDALLFFDLMDKVDIIIPFIHNIDVRDKGRRVISSIYNFIINMTFGIKLNYHNGTTFYRREIVNEVELSSYGFFYQAELLIKLIRKGYLFAEVPNYLGQRATGTSKAFTLKSFAEIIKGYIALTYNIHVKAVEGRKNYKVLNPNSVTYQRDKMFESTLDKANAAN